MNSFNVPIQEMKDLGLDVAKITRFLTLISAPQDCTKLSSLVFSLRLSVIAVSRKASSSPKLDELLEVIEGIEKFQNQLPWSAPLSDNNPMFGRYDEYPLYSFLSQSGSTHKEYIENHFQFIVGLILASVWITNTPLTRDYDNLLKELRILRRDNKINNALACIVSARSIPAIINSFSRNSQDTFKSGFRKLALSIQELIPESANSGLPLDNIESRLLGKCEDCDNEVATFREILMISRFHGPSVDRLGIVLHAILDLLPVVKSFDRRFLDVWPRWEITIQNALNILEELNVIPDITPPTKADFDKHSTMFCLIAKTEDKSHSRLIPVKAVLLIAGYINIFEKNDLNIVKGFFGSRQTYLAEIISKFYIHKSTIFQNVAKEYIPEWPSSSPTEWKNTFFENASKAPVISSFRSMYKEHEDRHKFIHTLRLVLDAVSEMQNGTTPPQMALTPHTQNNSDRISPQSKHSSVVIQPSRIRYFRSGRQISNRPVFNLFQHFPSTDVSDSNALAPELQTVEPVQDTPANQPNQLAVIQSLEVRYTNYRTAMDNQRLPWSWDCLNKFEVAALTQVLKESADVQDSSVLEKQGAFFVWLLLVTGQSIDQLLKFGLTHAIDLQGALLCGPIYRRFISSPPHAFQPNEQEKVLLRHHAEFIDLQLVPPFPLICRELGLIDPKIKPINHYQNIGTYLKLDVSGAESAIRQFLEQHRTRGLRLLPGRIRNVLNAELMKVSHDPVATHLLSSLPSDMPPAGVYYTSYSEDSLQRIYDQATARIFGKQS
ncbi:MAG: hypothetical protein PHI29_12085 [Gallionella sp.]|nr:hypothetical protein [Gallionella sp.]